MSPSNSTPSDSDALQAILGDNESISIFFSQTYQKTPKLYRRQSQPNTNTNTNTNSHDLNAVLNMGYEGLCEVLHISRSLFSSSCPVSTASSSSTEHSSQKHKISPPLVFKNQRSLDLSEIQTLYNSNPFAAYLDGCSLVQNHAQLLSPALWNLCQNLQRSFPHVFVNTYLTPPDSQAVSAHADDRDVMVLQLLGQKHWKVYEDVPIPHPYPEEQVGKYQHLPVPSKVLETTPLLDVILHPGDVLYLPRGWVHEAETTYESRECSFHATIAQATHDWTLGRMAAQEFQRIVESIPSYRLALSPCLAQPLHLPSSEQQQQQQQQQQQHLSLLEHQLQEIINVAKQQITTEFITSKYHEKIQKHNQQMKHLHEWISSRLLNNFNTSSKNDMGGAVVGVGPQAATHITLSSTIRASTPEERSSVPPTFDALGKPRPSGISIQHEDVCNTLLTMLTFVKENVGNEYLVRDIVPHVVKAKQDLELYPCDTLSLLSFVQCCVELGALAIVEPSNKKSF